jgi:hypothetical protein
MVTLGANLGGANPQPASWEAAGGEAAAEMALPGQPEPLAGKGPFQIPPPLLGEAADFAGEKLPQWQVCAQLRGQAPDQGTMTIPPMTAELFKVLEIKEPAVLRTSTDSSTAVLLVVGSYPLPKKSCIQVNRKVRHSLLQLNFGSIVNPAVSIFHSSKLMTIFDDNF